MTSKIKVFFVLPTLSAGGAERVISFVSQNLNQEKFDSTLIVIGFKKDNKYEVSNANTIYLNKSRVLKSLFKLLKIISKQKPQIVVSSISNLNVMMGLISILFSNTIFVGRHTFITKTPSEADKLQNNKILSLKSVFDYWDYGNKKLDYFICQSADMKQSIITAYGIDSHKIKVINNPITQTNIIKSNNHHNQTRKYITIGRLSKLKGHERILKMLSQLSFSFQYTIIGEGSYYDEIFKKVKELGLEQNVSYIKFTDNVYKHLIDHDMFLQGSFTEGFPNALLESCAVGVPVLAFDVPGGTKEIVENEINGFLVNNEDEFLKRLYDERKWNPEKIKESVNKKFNGNKILSDYEQFFIKIV
ncbi:glycosyltransferase [Winogradskyella bathintestinalis]|uniref:Glycosyltransferase n=1 Tax=Winogradskyella bathintestinalis TaxID=3035208 RepID=A0ABT7ZXL8_9FLAO|nr:glycosyltransferase [Winogradskyella bathintestinalis]MDN3493741.1 glycosyltransferase [Winogradskyella bathintestinalis]